jgi:hypothetical protein
MAEQIKNIITFEEFWKLYDKKTEKFKCEKIWSKISDADKIQIHLHVVDYVMSTPNKMYRKNPRTYLNGKCWNDEIIKPSSASKPQTNTGNNNDSSKYRGIGD